VYRATAMPLAANVGNATKARAHARMRGQIATQRIMAIADISAVQSSRETPELMISVDLGDQRRPPARLKLKSALRKTMIGDDPDTDARQ
jgi:hypothetical protein